MKKKPEIIGERLNGSVSSVGKAIERRDGAFIRQAALCQARQGADYLDVCASASEDEAEILRWIIEEVPSAADLTPCLDSPDGRVLEQAAGYCRRPGILNSVSLGREEDLERIFFFLKKHPGWKAVAMLGGRTGFPRTAEGRLEILEEILRRLELLGLEEGRVYADPVVEAAAFADSDDPGSRDPRAVLETISGIRRRYPGVHIAAAVSNISHGLPARSYVNQSFGVLALAAGADCLILDPLDKGLQGALSAAGSLLSLDGEPSCLGYVRDYRKHLF